MPQQSQIDFPSQGWLDEIRTRLASDGIGDCFDHVLAKRVNAF